MNSIQDLLDRIASALAAAAAARKKGDAMRKAQREPQALAAYREGVDRLLALAQATADTLAALPDAGAKADPVLAKLVRDTAELNGAAGGLFQRLGESDRALASYAKGARLEEAHSLAGTYNRLNELKLELSTGHSTLAAISPQIVALAEHIGRALDSDKSLADSGWVHADLGDCLALLGQADAAGRAYATFIAKAELRSPDRTLDVLNQIAQALRTHGDPDVHRLDAAIATLRSRLATH